MRVEGVSKDKTEKRGAKARQELWNGNVVEVKRGRGVPG